MHRTLELPGVDEKDIDVSLAHNLLTIKGEKKKETAERNGKTIRIERRYGSFSRSISMPENVLDSDKAKATFRNGVLIVTLPKREAEAEITRRIMVKSE